LAESSKFIINAIKFFFSVINHNDVIAIMMSLSHLWANIHVIMTLLWYHYAVVDHSSIMISL